MKSFDWIKNRLDIQLGMPALLYLCGALLYATLWFFFISQFSDITEAATAGKNFIIEGKVRHYWGLIFGPIFLAFTIPAVLKFLKGLNKRDGIEIMLMLWLAYNGIAFIAGAINRNSLRYLFGDTFLLSIIPLSYFFVRNYIKEARQIRVLFYFMLILQFILFSFPVHGFTAVIYKDIRSMGFYTFPGTEAFVIVSLMILAFLSRNIWIYMILLVAVLPAAFSRSLKVTFFFQTFAAMAVIFSIHITEKRFIKRFAAMLLVVFIFLPLFWNFGFIEEKALYRHFHSVYSKMPQTYGAVYNKMLNIIKKEDKVKDIAVKEARVVENVKKEEKVVSRDVSPAKDIKNVVVSDKVVQEAKPQPQPQPQPVSIQEANVISVRKLAEVIGEGRYEMESSIKKVGQHSLKFIKTNSNAAKHFYARIRISDDYERFYFGGRKITFGCWIFSPIAQKITLRIADIDSNSDIYANSTAYLGNGEWQFLTVSKEMRSRTEVVELMLFVYDYEDGVYYADGGIVVEGEIEGHKLSAMVNPDNDLFENFEVYTYPAMDHAINQRIYEARVVMEKLKNKPLSFLFGYGNGSVIDLSRTPDPTIRAVYGDRINAVHAIHILPFALLYRNGIIGLSIFIIFCIALIASFIKMIRYFKTQGEDAVILEVLFLNVFMMIMFGMIAAPNLFISITTGFCLGLIGAARQNIFSSKTSVNYSNSNK